MHKFKITTHLFRIPSIKSLRLKSNGSTEFKVDKFLLSNLRKETGYPFSKCHEALFANKNEYQAALDWLEKLSQEEGWKKADKLKGRLTGQGLIGAIVRDNVAAMVEVNCETDFVSRNDVFKHLVAQIATSALEFKERIIKQNQLVNSLPTDDIAHLREIIPVHDLEETKSAGTYLKDSIVSVVNQLGENIVLGKAVTVATSKKNVIAAYAHGNTSGMINNCFYGKYASLVVLGGDRESSDEDNLKSLAKGIAQHVVGMKPKFIDKDVNDPDSDDALLNQEYLLQDSLTVRNVLQNQNASIIDFVRYQCGE